MKDQPDKSSREQRLAAKLRENLRRRKAQTRGLSGARPEMDAAADDALSKKREDS